MIFSLALTTARCKPVNSGGSPSNDAARKNTHFFGLSLFGAYEWITFFWTTVYIPPLVGQPYQILSYGPPRADERLQMNLDNDYRSGYVFAVAI